MLSIFVLQIICFLKKIILNAEEKDLKKSDFYLIYFPFYKKMRKKSTLQSIAQKDWFIQLGLILVFSPHFHSLDIIIKRLMTVKKCILLTVKKHRIRFLPSFPTWTRLLNIDMCKSIEFDRFHDCLLHKFNIFIRDTPYKLTACNFC